MATKLRRQAWEARRRRRRRSAAGRGALGSAAEIAAVELDDEDEELLDQMWEEADARGEDFDSEEEREKLKARKRPPV